MLKLEDIHIGSQIRGLTGDNEVASIVQLERVGEAALTVIYRDSQGVSERMLFRSDEPRLELAQSGRPWAFDAPGKEFKILWG